MALTHLQEEEIRNILANIDQRKKEIDNIFVVNIGGNFNEELLLDDTSLTQRSYQDLIDTKKILVENESRLKQLLEQKTYNKQVIADVNVEVKQMNEMYNSVTNAIKNERIKILNSSVQRNSRVLDEIQTLIQNNQALLPDDNDGYDLVEYLPVNLNNQLNQLEVSIKGYLDQLGNLNNRDNIDIKKVKQLNKQIELEALKYKQLLQAIKQYKSELAERVQSQLSQISIIEEEINLAVEENTDTYIVPGGYRVEEFTLPDNIDIEGLSIKISQQKKELIALQKAENIEMSVLESLTDEINQSYVLFDKYKNDIKIYREIEKDADELLGKLDDLINNVAYVQPHSDDLELLEMVNAAKKLVDQLTDAKLDLWEDLNYKDAMNNFALSFDVLNTNIRLHQEQKWNQTPKESGYIKSAYEDIDMQYVDPLTDENEDDMYFVNAANEGESEFKPQKHKIDPSKFSVGRGEKKYYYGGPRKDPNEIIQKAREKQITTLKMLQKAVRASHDDYLKNANSSKFNKPDPQREKIIEEVDMKLNEIIKVCQAEGKIDQPMAQSLKAFYDLIKKKQNEVNKHHKSVNPFRKSRLSKKYDGMLKVIKKTAEDNKIHLSKVKQLNVALTSIIEDVDPKNVDQSNYTKH